MYMYMYMYMYIICMYVYTHAHDILNTPFNETRCTNLFTTSVYKSINSSLFAELN